jgi:hypothetical protein
MRASIAQGRTGGQLPATFAQDATAVNVPCSIQPASAGVVMRYMQKRIVVSNTLYFDNDWAPNLRDKWQYTDPDTGQVRFFLIHGWYTSIELKDSWTCDCEETRHL